MNRRQALDHLYALLASSERQLGGKRQLADSTARGGLPARGVYVFFEPGEFRADGRTPRVVRVGTHAVSENSASSLWGRLAQHRGRFGGTHPGGGNHRGSIFRQHLGTAIIRRDSLPEDLLQMWLSKKPADRARLRLAELPVEQEISGYIRAMPFLWVEVPDPPSKLSDRKRIEAGMIGLLSNAGKDAIDPPSPYLLAGEVGRRA